MKLITLTIVLVFLAAMLNSCLEPYEPEIPSGSNNYLVVDGVITNKLGPYTIKVTKSYAVNDVESDAIKVKGLTLIIEEENGSTETLVETEDGIYQTNTLQGKIGASYRLAFEYEGNQYQSSWEKINSSSPIDSVYYNVETRQTTDTENIGVQFYIDSYGSSQDATYYRYEWEETWEIGVFYPSKYDYVGEDMVVLATDPKHTCWKSNFQAVINLATSENLSKNLISNHKLTFIAGEEEKFREKYSLLVKQYSIDEKEYLYWKSLQESNEQLGSLYDKQPSNIRGNMFNLTDLSDFVLGYFSASGVQEERVFIEDLQELSDRVRCGIPLDTILKEDFGEEYDERVSILIGRGNFFYKFVRIESEVNPIGVFLSNSQCSDCTIKGGDVNKPEYWDD